LQKKFAIKTYDGTIITNLIIDLNAELSGGRKSNVCSVTNISATLTPTAILATTKVYSNNAYSFTLSYPAQLNVQENPTYLSLGGSGQLSSSFNVAFVDVSKNYPPEHPFEFYASVFKNDRQLTPKQWFISQGFPFNLGGANYKTINAINVVDFASEGAGGRTVYFFTSKNVVALAEGAMTGETFTAVVSSFQSSKSKTQMGK